MLLKNQMKHLKHVLTTCVHNHYNICNILIYFYNIDVKTLTTHL
jgi:hypothetical protein